MKHEINRMLCKQINVMVTQLRTQLTMPTTFHASTTLLPATSASHPVRMGTELLWLRLDFCCNATPLEVSTAHYPRLYVQVGNVHSNSSFINFQLIHITVAHAESPCDFDPDIEHIDNSVSQCKGTVSGADCVFGCIDKFNPSGAAKCLLGKWDSATCNPCPPGWEGQGCQIGTLSIQYVNLMARY